MCTIVEKCLIRCVPCDVCVTVNVAHVPASDLGGVCLSGPSTGILRTDLFAVDASEQRRAKETATILRDHEYCHVLHHAVHRDRHH